ncbi:cytochrome c5 [Roseiarcus fermentans]|uniref:Cytochrome c5 n=1 Tax=Roseiarcus fermentans TaxID=1473586 RepID=A0A366ETH4_9HYPH|nr:c-type cytochrome [Roseiarcus fermentans]RBP05702.1 cytochrome c5 [Roseiarcus fermentans]
MRQGLFAAAFAALLTASCGQSAQPARPTAAEVEYAARAEPSPPALAALYDRSCRTCHGSAASGAPLAGQVSAWAPRLAARGADGLLASFRKGRNAMPPGGLCPDCGDDDARRIIAFMSTEPTR